MFDIGVNLTSGQLASDIEQVLQRARDAGVFGMAITGTSVQESHQALDLCQQWSTHFDGTLCATVGVHPHHASEWSDSCRATLLELAKNKFAVAIGETGLDFNRNFSSPQQQIEAFTEQLQIAVETGLPVFLHERDAFAQQIAILEQFRNSISNAVAHCFTGSAEQLSHYLDLDFYIGITGWICDERRGAGLAAIVKDVPLDRLLIETDAPWLLPRNMEEKSTSKRNEPANLRWIVKKIAENTDHSEAEICLATDENARRFFRLGPGDT